MIDKKRIIILGSAAVVLFIFSIIVLLLNNVSNSDIIPDDYIAVFNGGAGEITYSTYIYKIDNGHANYGFEYINTTNTTKYWGSTEWDTKITKKGKFTWTDEAFAIAKKNYAYSYVKVPSGEIYTIDEFKSKFIMN